MASSLLSAPETRRPLWSDDGPPRQIPPAPPTGGGGAPRRRRRRPPIALWLLVASLLGGGTSVGALAATGNLGHDTTTTVVQGTTTADRASGLNAEALYASVSAGVVDITSEGVSSSSALGGQSSGTATGTGFEIDDEGHILTAAHVIEGASKVTVTLADGTTRTATVLGSDDSTDVAVLKMDATGLTLSPLKLGNSGDVGVGEQVAAIGDPFGYERSLSTGVISGIDRTIQAPNGFTVAHALQTDAAINPGNSGGPVLDASGAVIGITDQIATDGSADQSSGVGFLVPIDLVQAELTALKAGQTVQHAYLGVASSDAAAGGVAVGQVTSGGPAAAAGLRTGDVITKLGDATIADQNDLVAAIAAHRPGDKVTVSVKRGGGTDQLTVTLATQPTTAG